MRIGFGLSIPANLLPLEKVIELVIKTDEHNFDSFWIHENPMYGDSITIISILSQLKCKIKLGLGCTSIITRHPIMIASTAITIQNLCKGRFILGLGLGGFPWLPLIGYPIHPVEKTRPLRRMIEAVKIIRDLISGEIAMHEGEFYKVKGFKLMIGSKFETKIYIASLSRKTLRLTPAIANGVITSPGVLTPKDLEILLSYVKSGEEKYGKKIDKAAYVLASISKDEREAIEAVKKDPYFIYQLAEVVSEESLKQYGVKTEKLTEIRKAWNKRDLIEASKLIGDDMVLALSVTGKKEEAIERFEEYAKTQHDLYIISPVGDLDEAITTFS